MEDRKSGPPFWLSKRSVLLISPLGASDKERLSVVVQGIENGSASLLDAKGELHAYYHTDYLDSTDDLTSAVNSKVIWWTSYSQWGEITHNAYFRTGAF